MYNKFLCKEKESIVPHKKSMHSLSFRQLIRIIKRSQPLPLHNPYPAVEIKTMSKILGRFLAQINGNVVYQLPIEAKHQDLQSEKKQKLIGSHRLWILEVCDYQCITAVMFAWSGFYHRFRTWWLHCDWESLGGLVYGVEKNVLDHLQRKGKITQNINRNANGGNMNVIPKKRIKKQFVAHLWHEAMHLLYSYFWAIPSDLCKLRFLLHSPNGCTGRVQH